MLELAPLPSNVRLARLVASGLGSELSMTVEEIDDLRIAIDEACHWMLSNEVAGLVRVSFHATGGDLAVCVTADLTGEGHPMAAQVRQVLDAVTAAWSVRRDGVGCELGISPRRDAPGPP
jgi:anti-sigma regulatory factor (Ser/Thr protein kinase)